MLSYKDDFHPLTVLNFCTFSGNNATSAGGALRFSGIDPPVISNCIIYGNNSGISNNNVSNPNANYSNSLIQGITSTANGNINGNTDPLFTNPINYSQAPTISGNYRLSIFSPCFDKGNINDIPNDLADDIITDLDGNARVMGCVPDLGAYEIRADQNYYVDGVNGNDVSSGFTWNTAFRTMSRAIQEVNQNCYPYNFNIYVAKGVYYPTGQQNSTDKDATFLIKRGGVKIYGGYPNGGGTRNLKTNATIFSGDIGSVNYSSDNSYHIMVFAGIDLPQDNILIDGIQFQGGNASGSGNFTYNNFALPRNQGAAVYIKSTNIGNRLQFNNCEFSGNQAGNNGGAFYIENANPLFSNCIGIGNYSPVGSFASMSGAAPKFINCTLSGNKGSGGILKMTNSNPTTFNSIIWGNESNFDSDFISTNTIQYSLVEGLDILNNNHNLSSRPYFYNSVAYENAPISGGNYRLQPCSPAIDAGLNNFIPNNISTDILGNQRITNSKTDMGAYEWNGNYPTPRYYVKQGGTGTGSSWDDAIGDLQEAINKACGETDIWVAAGTYKPQRRSYNLDEVDISSDQFQNAFVLKPDVKIYGGFPNNGNPNMNNRNWQNNPTILSGDAGIEGNQNDNVAHVVISSGNIGTAELNGFTIRDGMAYSATGIYVTVNSNTIEGRFGGGMYITNSSPRIVNCTIINNTASNIGSGVFITNSSPTFENCQIKNNTSYSNGGGIYSSNSNPTINNSIISGNTTVNAGSIGGGIFSEGNSNIIIRNSLIYSNSSKSYGGGISSYAANTQLTNVTISGNTASYGYNEMYIGLGGNHVIKNSIIWGNGTITSGFTTVKNSLIQGYSDTNNGNLSGDTDPLFADRANGIFTLLPCSPAINAGSTDTVGLGLSSLDLNSKPRIFGNRIDMGAYEFQNQIFVNSNGIIYVDSANTCSNGDGSSWKNALKSFNRALQIADSINNQSNSSFHVNQIWVAKGTFQPSSGQSFTMIKDVKIYGGFAGNETTLNQRDLSLGNTSILKGNDNSVIRNNNNGLSATAILDGFTLVEGKTTLGGGGVYNYNVSPTFSNCFFYNNFATIQGGGMDNESSSNPNIINCIFEQNISQGNGGAIFNYLNSSPKIRQCKFINNKAQNGGAIGNNNNAAPQIVNSIFTQNTATGSGGAINNNNNSLAVKITNSLLMKNKANIGATINSENTLSNLILNCTIVKDSANQGGILTNGISTIINTVIWGNSNSPYGGGINIINSVVQGQPNAIDPHFADFTNDDFRIGNGCSPLINAGTLTDTVGLGLLNFDLDGNPRVYNSMIDIGAYEYQADFGPCVNSQGIIYVDSASVCTDCDGSSWAKAFSSFAEAIQVAGDMNANAFLPSDSVKQIWVARGIYQPSDGESFTMLANVKIYGGFAGTETDLSQRDLNAGHTSVLKGNGNRVIMNKDNGLSLSTLLDGFTITGSGTLYSIKGAGIYNENVSMSLSNCIIQNNLTDNEGGGIYAAGSTVVLTDCRILSNYAENDGGAVRLINNSRFILKNCIVKSNSSGINSGVAGISVYQSQIQLINSLVIKNSGLYHANGLYASNSDVQLINTTMAGNYFNDIAIYDGTTVIQNSIIGASYGIYNGPLTVENSLIQGSNITGDGNLSGTTDPLFTDPNNNDYTLQPCSPAVNAGGSDTTGLNIPLKDLINNSRISGSKIDMGAYEFQFPKNYHLDINGVLYVNNAISCVNGIDGSSWNTALNSFAQALRVADSINTHTADESEQVKQIWVAKGTYQPVQNSSFTMIKNVKIYGGFAGTETSLSQRDLNAGNISILKGNGNSVIRNDDNGLNSLALLDGFTVSDGSSSKGGGVYNNNSSPSFANCIFKNNQATVQGGGMHNEFSASPIITNCLFQNNSAGTGGGGVFNYYNASPKISQSRFISNTSTNGGGLATNTNANPVITNCEFKWNVATGTGGAINNNSSDGVKIINCLIIRNRSNDNGGGINNVTSSPLIVNCTFSQDTSAVSGGAINNSNSSPTIENCIISGNTSGIANTGTSSPVITYSLVQEMAADATNHNLDGSLSPYFFSISNDSYGLSSCSPAINAGNPDTSNLNLPLLDFGQNPRVFDNVIDLGAFEFQSSISIHPTNGILYVNKNNLCYNNTGASWTNAFSDFDQALQATDYINSHTSNPSDSVKQIWVAKGTYQPSAGSYFVMIKNVKIYGGFAGNESDLSQRNLNAGNISILKGNGNSVIKNDNNGLSSTALLDGFTIQDGNSSKGGGVYNNNSSPSFANCIFKNNQATVQGGGMHNEFNASPLITNCTFQNNSAGTGGGGVFNYYNASPKISQSKFISNTSTNGGGLATNTNANPVITNCEFKWNVATGTGGAINNNSSNGVKIINCLIIRNKAIGNGGGVNNASSSSFIANCTFSLDSAANGGAIYNNNSNPNIKNCIISGNTSGMTNTNNSSPVITYSLVQGINGDMNNHILDGSIDPGFVNISNDDYTLFACSPLINQGTIDTSGLNLPATDLNQQPRIFENRIDMGAYETQSPHQLVSEVTSQPIQTDNCQNTNLSITANNATAFQWQMNVNNIFTNITDNAFYSGTTSPVLSIKDTTLAENTYRCIVIGDCQNDTSSTITYHHYPKIYFVKPNGSGNQSGSSWENASNDLQSVINSACPNSQIWVAEGVYYPTHPADNLNVVDINNRNNSFILKSDVKIFGGFPHTGNPGFNDRDQNLHPSILSGDIGTLNNQSDNVYHVLISAGDVGTAELNGFTVTQSNADGNASIVINNLSIDRGSGAGIHLVNSSPIIANCRFIQNQGKFGSGIFISNSQPNIQNCFFYGNHASVHGAGIFSFLSSNPSISNCVFFGNRADDKGAGMLSDNSTATIINCTFSGNQSIQGNGATIYNVASPTVITNCIIYGNSGGIYNESSTSSVSYSDIQEGYEGVENVDTDPSFLNAPAYSTAPFAVGDYRLQSCSPLINQGDNSAIPQETVTDISGNPRIQDGKVDIGAYENKGYSLQTIANTTLTANDNCQNADNWTHFSKKDDENKIFISINTLGQDLGQISASTTLNENYGKYAQTISMPYGQMKNFYPLNRSWTIQSQNTFLHPVGVRFYFNKTDSADVAALIPIDSMQQFIVYKVAGTDVWDSTAQNYTEYQYGAVADLTHYTFGTFQGLKYVEFQVSSFSTGTMAIKMDDATLPLDLLSFTASVSDDKVLLQWQTVNEVNVSHFEIESSPDAVVWNKIAHQNALNGIDQKYTVWDENPRHGVNYYRLKMIDLDGSFKYSKIVSVSLNAQSQIQYIIYPNPNKGLFYIQTIGLIDDYTKAFLYDSQGRILFEKRLQDNIEQLNIPTLVSGIYFLRIENNSNVTVKKIIVK
ncbi:MAG: right-handed parallel beta-helix repeat-containing protein [Chitinophagales bacterium]|nr:right-handed parallel beta-helix repeat-containing protein [Chitinophagales bacterium]